MPRMITAVNKQIRALPQEIQDVDARCELARALAREYDAGHLAVTLQLNRVLGDLAKAGRPPAARKPAKDEAEQPQEPERTWLDQLEARRSRRLATAADRERPARGDDRRAGGS